MNNATVTDVSNNGHIDYFPQKEMGKYGVKEYGIAVDPVQDDRATEIKFFSTRRPHMRAFHTSWMSFFSAFFAWFAIAPLMPVIKKSLHLTKEQVYASNICAIASTVAMRFLAGPLCDIYGPRVLMAIVLVLGSIPVYLIGTVHTFGGLCTIRFFIGILGCSFVMCQYWTSQMFAKNVVGVANAWSAGWGNLGGGVTQLFMGSLLWPLFCQDFFPGDKETAWRSIFIVPATMTFICGIVTYFAADDSPFGNFKELKAAGHLKPVFALPSFITALLNFNTFFLFVQYGASFGVELTFFNVAASYFHEKFGLTIEQAASIASSFGFINVISRPLGGYASDVLNGWLGFRGRLLIHFFCLLVGGIGIIIFSKMDNVTNATGIMALVAFFIQAANGTCYSIVPYVDPGNVGAVSGIVGGGGNMGALFWGFIFLYGNSADQSFYRLGWIVVGCSFTVFFLNIPGFAMLAYGNDTPHLQRNESKFSMDMLPVSNVSTHDGSQLPDNNTSSHGLVFDETPSATRV